MPHDDGQDGLTVAIERTATSTTVVLGGQLDLASSAALTRAAELLRPLTGPVYVNVADVTFIDSTGLRCLMRLHEASIAATGTKVRLVDVSHSVHRVLELTGLLDTFEVEAASSTRES